jgi:hypothetical protein
MNTEDKAYTLSILTSVINTLLDKANAVIRQGLQSAEINRDQLVWEIATKIYSQSGHKVDLSMVRDIVDLRIGVVREQLALEDQEKIARKAAELEAQRIAQIEAENRAIELEIRRRKFLKESSEILRKLSPESIKDKRKSGIVLEIREIIFDQLGIDLEANLDDYFYENLNVEISDDDLFNFVIQRFAMSLRTIAAMGKPVTQMRGIK